MVSRMRRFVVVLPTLIALGFGWILYAVDLAKYHRSFINQEAFKDGIIPVEAYMIEFLPYWIFSIGVPGIILLVILEVAANNHVMKLFTRIATAGTAIALGGCLLNQTIRVYLDNEDSSIRDIDRGAPVVGLIGGLVCALGLIWLIGVNPLLWEKFGSRRRESTSYTTLQNTNDQLQYTPAPQQYALVQTSMQQYSGQSFQQPPPPPQYQPTMAVTNAIDDQKNCQ